MKGTFFQRPLEFQLQVEGESWVQGDRIQGKLIVKNHGPEPTPLADMHVHLADGELKRVRQKSADAFEVQSSATGGSGEVAPQGSAEFPWQFELGLNAPITDKSRSLFLLYGRGEDSSALGQLQLPIHPAPIVQEILKTLSVHHRFVVKSQKAGKRSEVEVKLAPPDARSFATMDQLILSFRFNGDTDSTLQIRYSFQVKKIEATAAAFDVKKQKKEFEQTMSEAQYRTSSGRFDHEHIEAAIAEVISQVESKLAF